MTRERDILVSVAKVLRAMAGSPQENHGVVSVEQARLLAIAASVERVLDVAVWEQTPSFTEWKERVYRP